MHKFIYSVATTKKAHADIMIVPLRQLSSLFLLPSFRFYSFDCHHFDVFIRLTLIEFLFDSAHYNYLAAVGCRILAMI